jgi:phage/plasmid-like protein (TIGR03299 family)
MAHALDFSKGFAAVAAIGGRKSMWHQNGQEILPTDTPEEIQAKAGADFEVKIAQAKFDRQIIGLDGLPFVQEEIAENVFHLYRSDTGRVMNTVTERYKPVQPATIFQFFKQLCAKHGYQIETAGVLANGGRYWVTANTRNVLQLPGKDKLQQFVTIATSCDGSMSTEGFTTEFRVVCDNTLQSARHDNVLSVKNRHSTVVDWDKISIKLELVSDAWTKFSLHAKEMAKFKVNDQQAMKLLLNAYYSLDTDEKVAKFLAAEKLNEKQAARRETDTKQMMNRLYAHLNNGPGAKIESSDGTLWGLMNAVTYDVDHDAGAKGRTPEAKFVSSQWKDGAAIKDRAWTAAVALVTA